MILIDKIRGNKNLVNGGVFTLFAFLNQGFSFVLLIILANYIAPDEYGQLNLFTTFVQLFTIFISLGTTGYIAVTFFKKERAELNRTINAVLIVSTGMLFVFFVVLAIFSSWFERVIGINVEYQWIALLICYCQVYNAINLDIWRLKEQPFQYGLYSLSMVLLNFVITLILVITYHQGWLGRLYAQVAVAIVYFFVSLVFLFKRGYIVFNLPEKKLYSELFNFGIPLIPHMASGWLKQGADRYIINFFLSVSVVGLYSFAMNFANIIIIIGTSFNATNSVYIYKNLSEGYLKNKAKLKKQEKFMMLFYLAVCMALYFVCLWGIPMFLPKYSDSVIYLLPLCLSAMFGCYYQLFVNYLFYYLKTKQLMVITFSVSLIQVLLSLALTRFGALYTAYISAFAQLLTFLCVFMYSRKVLREIEIKEKNE